MGIWVVLSALEVAERAGSALGSEPCLDNLAAHRDAHAVLAAGASPHLAAPKLCPALDVNLILLGANGVRNLTHLFLLCRWEPYGS